jgi:hypothetical protein
MKHDLVKHSNHLRRPVCCLDPVPIYEAVKIKPRFADDGLKEQSVALKQLKDARKLCR